MAGDGMAGARENPQLHLPALGGVTPPNFSKFREGEGALPSVGRGNVVPAYPREEGGPSPDRRNYPWISGNPGGKSPRARNSEFHYYGGVEIRLPRHRK